ncbi:hypothetical protein KY285_032858 [Solanum tuberosum]|nr:hypothetical protein KY289_032968 [Solanum tuberosum]KAH0647610.1 hypothetical protein KY285_032858 [Solanum tuberosum]
MNVKATPLKVSAKLSNNQIVKSTTYQNNASRKLSLKEIQAKEYPFMDSDDLTIFEDLLAFKLFELPEMKHPNEAGRISNPNYCKYHHLMGHPIEKCFIF